MEPAEKGLSQFQQRILVWLGEQTEVLRVWTERLPETEVLEADRFGPRVEVHPRAAARAEGIRWRDYEAEQRSVVIQPKKRTPADRAAVSKALRRLEERGLLIRSNQMSGGPRITHVRLTDAGVAAAERLTKEMSSLWSVLDWLGDARAE